MYFLLIPYPWIHMSLFKKSKINGFSLVINKHMNKKKIFVLSQIYVFSTIVYNICTRSSVVKIQWVLVRLVIMFVKLPRCTYAGREKMYLINTLLLLHRAKKIKCFSRALTHLNHVYELHICILLYYLSIGV